MPTLLVETNPDRRSEVFALITQAGAQNSIYLGEVSKVLFHDLWVLSGDNLSIQALLNSGPVLGVEEDEEYAFFVNQSLLAARRQPHEPLPPNIRTNLPLGSPDIALGRPAGPTEFLAQGGLGPLLDRIGAPAAWQITRGDGSTIVVLDSGVNGALVSPEKRAGSWSDGFLDPWIDDFGHGTMLALMAAGNGSSNGFAGAAPTAKIFSARPAPGPNGGMLKSGVLKALEHVIGLITSGSMGPTVVLNGWGIFGCLSLDDA